MSSEPVVSVVLSVHNGMPYLPEAIGSLLGQTFNQFELLVIDDGSTDATASYLASLTDPRVRVERLEKVGLPKALNRGLKLAKGRLIARLDADDVAYPTRLEKQVGYFRDHPDCVLISCHFDCVDADGRRIGDGHNPISDLAARWMLLFTTPFVHPGAMFVRDEALAIGGYNAEFRLAQDYDLWSRLAARGTIGNFPEKLIAKRLHRQAFGGANATQQRDLASRIAGTYAQAALPSIDAETARELYRFLWWGELPERSPSQVVGAYLKARTHFQQLAGESDPDLTRWMDHIDGHLLGRCLGQVRSNVFRPNIAFKWLALARSIKPDESHPLRLLGRRLRRMIGRRTPIVDRETSELGVRYTLQANH